jgi:hypothetical protein
MRLFDVPAGERITLLTHEVGVEAGGRTLMLDVECVTALTATDDFWDFGGVWRRRFAHARPPLANHTDDVWVADGPFTRLASPPALAAASI